ncbi:MAG: rhodanese-like domain-containing protein, partial [Desulfobulbales bacterium]
KNTPPDMVILDVRDSGAAGIIPGAVNIPMGQLAARLADLSKDKEYITYCNTGILAGIALQTLQDNGFRARYLDAVVQIAPDGSFEVTEK